MKRHSFRLAAAALGLLLVLPTGLPASAASSFDAGYYATHYPDVAAACGTDEGTLLQHYIQFGASEGRKPSAWGRAGDTDLKLTDAQIAAIWSPVPIKELANYKSLKRKMTDDEFAQAYEQARRIVTPLAFKSREEQLAGIANALREMVDDGTVAYSTDVPHYNDAYGYLVLHVASCAGCTRTTGLCLNMLGIPYEHVNENQWSHQWCRVPHARRHLLDLRCLRPVLRPGACSLPAPLSVSSPLSAREAPRRPLVLFIFPYGCPPIVSVRNPSKAGKKLQSGTVVPDVSGLYREFTVMASSFALQSNQSAQKPPWSLHTLYKVHFQFLISYANCAIL